MVGFGADFDDDSIDAESSKKELNDLLKKMKLDKDKVNPAYENEIAEQQKTFGNDVNENSESGHRKRIMMSENTAQDIIEKRRLMESVGKKVRSEELKSFVAKGNKILSGIGNLFATTVAKPSINKTTGQITVESKYQKFRYDKFGRKIGYNSAWLKSQGLTRDSVDLGGRISKSGKQKLGLQMNRTSSRLGKQLLKSQKRKLQYPEEVQQQIELMQLQQQKASAMRRKSLAGAMMGQIANKFNERLIEEQQIAKNIIERQRYNTAPSDFVRRRVQQRQEQIRQQHDFAKETSLLKAHEGNLTSAENSINFLQVEGSILHAPNVFSSENSQNIMKSSRLNILQTREANNDLHLM